MLCKTHARFGKCYLAALLYCAFESTSNQLLNHTGIAAFPRLAQAEEQEKESAPAVVRYAIVDDPLDRSTWRDADDFAQGERIGFAVVGTLPEGVDRMRGLSYWLVAEPAPGHTYVEGSAAVWLVSRDGSARDVTESLTVGLDGAAVVAGASDLTVAIPGITDTDELVLAYEATLNGRAKYGFAEGNVSYAHAEYSPSVIMSAVFMTNATQTPVLHAASYKRAAAREGLARTDELLVTVYTYRITVHKQDENGSPLAGARLALRDATGAWYVRGSVWSASEADATVATTGSTGTARFDGVDSERYEVVELVAPEGYAVAEPIDVTLEADPRGGGTTLAASSRTGNVASVDAKRGEVALRMVDQLLGENDHPVPPQRPTAPTTPEPKAPPTVPELLAKTGDLAVRVGPYVALSAILILAGVALRRPRGSVVRMEGADRMDAAGTQERKQDGNG